MGFPGMFLRLLACGYSGDCGRAAKEGCERDRLRQVRTLCGIYIWVYIWIYIWPILGWSGLFSIDFDLFRTDLGTVYSNADWFLPAHQPPHVLQAVWQVPHVPGNYMRNPHCALHPRDIVKSSIYV